MVIYNIMPALRNIRNSKIRNRLFAMSIALTGGKSDKYTL